MALLRRCCSQKIAKFSTAFHFCSEHLFIFKKTAFQYPFFEIHLVFLYFRDESKNKNGALRAIGLTNLNGKHAERAHLNAINRDRHWLFTVPRAKYVQQWQEVLRRRVR
ncbi:hypothetical protein DFO53_2718 [Enterobacter sp. AG5470]|nr:hypothetical protein DFO53_2718 [Enterobacter sp. AG5470]